MADYNLTLVGASWMSVETDNYVLKRQVDSGATTEAALCAGVQGYDDPCPTSDSSSLTYHFTATIFYLTVFYLSCVTDAFYIF